MWRRVLALCGLIAIIGGFVIGTAHADELAAPGTSLWPTAPDPANSVATRGSSIQMTPTLPAPTTTAPPTTVNPGASTDVPANSGSGRRVIYAKRAQRVWQVNDDGSVATTYRVSGRMDQPNPGSYRVWSRSAYTCSINNSSTCMRWMVRFARGPEGDNIGFHEIPRNNGRPLQSDSQLGTPLSHGCVRQSTADAQAMWNFAYIGTVVVVVA
jgi:lipoprotein-anchoring transpeptidase ErfK/SrfK